MWSVTEQNHLHYPSVMFHCFRLVHWWPPTHFSASFSLLLLLRVSIFCKCVVTNGRLPSSIFWKQFLHWFLFYFTLIHLLPLLPSFLCSVTVLLHHLSLVHTYFFLSFCFSSHFALPWDVAIMSSLADLAALVSFVRLLPCLSFFKVTHLLILLFWLLLKILYFPCQ